MIFNKGAGRKYFHQISPDLGSYMVLHPPVHIEICVGGCNAMDGRKDKQGGGIIFFLRPVTRFIEFAKRTDNELTDRFRDDDCKREK